MGAVDADAHQGGPGRRAGLERRGRVGAVVVEHVAAVGDVVLAAEVEEAAGQVVVERAVRVLHRDRHRVLARGAGPGPRRRCRRDELGDVAVEAVRGPMPTSSETVIRTCSGTAGSMLGVAHGQRRPAARRRRPCRRGAGHDEARWA